MIEEAGSQEFNTLTTGLRIYHSWEDLDCSLVSSKNFSEILPSNGLSPGQGEVSQGGLKVLHF